LRRKQVLARHMQSASCDTRFSRPKLRNLSYPAIVPISPATIFSYQSRAYATAFTSDGIGIPPEEEFFGVTKQSSLPRRSGLKSAATLIMSGSDATATTLDP